METAASFRVPGLSPALGRLAGAGAALAKRQSLFGDIVVVVFLVAQLLDGVFTYVGVTTFGPSIEANPLMTWLILTVGEIPALAAAKSVAIAFGIALHLTAVHRVVAVLTGLYLLFAVIPWAHLLFF